MDSEDRAGYGQIGLRIQELRAAQRLSLSDLARRAGIGKGTLSELESGRRNPTLDTLYALTVPLGVGLSALLVESTPALAHHPEIAGSGVSARLLDVVARDGGGVVETYRLVVDPRRTHRSPGHGPGVFEQLTLISGRARVGVIGAERELISGETLVWSSEGPHTYRALDGVAAVGVLLITCPDHPNDLVPTV